MRKILKCCFISLAVILSNSQVSAQLDQQSLEWIKWEETIEKKLSEFPSRAYVRCIVAVLIDENRIVLKAKAMNHPLSDEVEHELLQLVLGSKVEAERINKQLMYLSFEFIHGQIKIKEVRS